VIGVLVALLITNLLLADQHTLKSLFCIDQPATEDAITIDFYKNITQ